MLRGTAHGGYVALVAHHGFPAEVEPVDPACLEMHAVDHGVDSEQPGGTAAEHHCAIVADSDERAVIRIGRRFRLKQVMKPPDEIEFARFCRCVGGVAQHTVDYT